MKAWHFVLILPNQEETNKFEMLLLRKIDHCFDYFDNSDTLAYVNTPVKLWKR